MRSRSPEEVDPEIGNETYMQEVFEIIKKYGFVTDSVIVGHIDVEKQSDVPRMVEIAAYYKIPYNSKLFIRKLYGVPLICALDDKNCPLENCYDIADWDDNSGDIAIKYPLPSYADFLRKHRTIAR